MTDFLTRLAERSVGVGELVSPRPASLFEPRAASESPALVEEWVEVDVEPSAPAPDREEPAPQPAQVHEQAQEPNAEPDQVLLPPQPDVVVERSTPTKPQDAPPPDREPRAPAPPAVAATAAVTEPSAGAEPDVVPATPPTAVVVRGRDRLVPPRAPALERLGGSERQGQSVGLPGAAAPAPLPATVPPAPSAPATAPSAPATAAPAEEPPVVRVTIGRVDVRAVLSPTPPERPAPRRRPRLTLEEYLRQGGGR